MRQVKEPVPTVAARALAPLLMRLGALRVDIAAFLGRRGIDPALFGDDAARIPLERTKGIWEEAAELASDPNFGLHVAEAVQASSFGLFSYLGVTSATWGSAVGRVCTYFKLISDASGYELFREGERVRFGSRPWPDMPTSRQINEFSIAVMVCYARQNLERPLDILGVTFAHGAPPNLSEHERIFQTHIAFDQPMTAFSFDANALNTPLRSADSKLSSILEPSATAEIDRLDQTGVRVSDRARFELRSLLRAGIPTLEDLSQRLAMAPRSLQRRLSEDGTSFRALLLETQGDLAQRLLGEPALSIAEVAVLLGFSETAAFHRSFQRTTGMTPGRFRSLKFGT